MSQLPDSFPRPREEDSHGTSGSFDEALAQLFDEADREHTESGGLALAERNGDPQTNSELGRLAVNAEPDNIEPTDLPLPSADELRFYEGLNDDETVEETLEDQMLDEILHDGGIDIVSAAERYIRPDPKYTDVEKRLIYHIAHSKPAQESGKPVETLEDALRLYRQGNAPDEATANKIKDADPVSLVLSPDEYQHLHNLLTPIPEEPTANPDK